MGLEFCFMGLEFFFQNVVGTLRNQMTSQISKFGTVCKIAKFLAS